MLPVKQIHASDLQAHKTLLILGDSLSAGYGIAIEHNWTTLLQSRLDKNKKQIQLANASISGDTTANGLNRLPKALQQFKPDIVLIELGANDGLRGLPLEHIKQNLELLIKTSLAAQAQVLLMEINIPPNYGKQYTQAFKQIYTDLARQYSLPLLPFLIKDVALNAELIQDDGLHPNEKAQIKISELMWQTLKPLI